ncbi:hypothetical protein OL119_001063 [Salmonella enterica]|nr:hypothetical protein [Salmonella enterica]
MIYHYTDLHAAKSIAEKEQVWLTDYRYLNDEQEFIDGYSVLLDTFIDYDDYSDEHSEEFRQFIKSVLESIDDSDFPGERENHIFVASFSKTPDLLSQWRSYGMYCLGFEYEQFQNGDVRVLDCHYMHDLGDAMEYAKEIIEENIIPELLKEWGNGKSHIIKKTVVSLLEIFSLSFKHKAFSDEDEIRFVVSCEPENEKIDYRVKGNILIPYYPLDFDSVILKSIQIGPIQNQQLAIDSMNMFARKISRKVQIEGVVPDYELVVDNSDIPYRSF